MSITEGHVALSAICLFIGIAIGCMLMDSPSGGRGEWEVWFRYFMDKIEGSRYASVEEAAARADAAMGEIKKRRSK